VADIDVIPTQEVIHVVASRRWELSPAPDDYYPDPDSRNSTEWWYHSWV